MRKLLALVYAVVAYLFFFLTFLYAILFLGNVFVPKSVDSGPTSAVPVAVAIDLVLLGIFAIQHSVMARRGFKQRWTRIVSWYVERTTYVVCATAALALLLWQWRPLPAVVWDITATWAAVPLEALFWVGWAILLVSTFLINHFELFGLAQAWAYFRGQEFQRPPFKTPALYRMVRHPIYLGFVVAFWSVPRMTAGHLLFSGMATAYILVGIFFEERDLLAAYGAQYQDYRRRVPMLLPIPRFGSQPPSDPKSSESRGAGMTA